MVMNEITQQNMKNKIRRNAEKTFTQKKLKNYPCIFIFC